MRFGLCCLFKKEPVSFRTTTAKSLLALPRDLQLQNSRKSAFTMQATCIWHLKRSDSDKRQQFWKDIDDALYLNSEQDGVVP